MKHSIQKVLLFFCIFSLLHCKKESKPGVKTNLTGLVNDPSVQLPISNISIYIEEYKPGANGSAIITLGDSTKSGSDGRYALSFTTSGQGSRYLLLFSPGQNYYAAQNTADINIGTDQTINLPAYKVHTLKARIIVTNNLNPPLRIYSPVFPGSTIISSTSTDSIVFFKVLPYSANYIYFNVTNADTSTIYNARIDTLLLPTVTDTFTHTFQVTQHYSGGGYKCCACARIAALSRPHSFQFLAPT